MDKIEMKPNPFPESHYSLSGHESLYPKRRNTGESEGSSISLEEKVADLAFQVEFLKQELNKHIIPDLDPSRKENGNDNLSESPEENKVCENQEPYIDLKNRVDKLEEKLNEKENLSGEAIKEITTKVKDVENKLKEVHEKQEKHNEVLKIDKRIAIKEKHKKFSKKPHHPQFCRAFYFLLYALFEKSIRVSYKLEGKMPTKSKIFPRIVEVSAELLSLVPYAGPILDALKGIVKTIYQEIKKGKERCKATNIRNILEKYVDCDDFEEPNLLAADISCEITQLVGQNLKELVKQRDSRKKSRFHKLIQKIFKNDLDSEIEIAISAFECLLVKLYKKESGKIKAQTEAEFIIYCVKIVNKGDWHHPK